MTPTITPITSPHPYFKITTTGRYHHVVKAQWVRWSPSEAFESVQFRCGNISNADRGVYHATRPWEGIECARCLKLFARRRRVPCGRCL